MDPLPPTLTGPSPWGEADTPQTHDLKHLRAKRVAYYESIGIIKGDSSRQGSQPVSTAFQDTKVSHLEHQAFGLRCPQKLPCYSASGKNSPLHEGSKVDGTEAMWPLEQRTQEGPWKKSYPMELDLYMLADALVPETQKLRHVIDWAQMLLSNPLEEHGLMSLRTSLGRLPSHLGQGENALGSKNNATLTSSDSSCLLREGQSGPRTDIHSFFLSPQSNLSEMGLSLEFSSSFQEKGFAGDQFCGWQESAVRNVREGRAIDSFKQTESAPPKDRTGNRHIQNSREEERLSEWLGIQSQLRHTFEENKDLGEAEQSPPGSGYFWIPLADSSDEEPLDEPGESKGTPTKGVPWRKRKPLGGTSITFTSDSTRVSQTRVLESGVSSSGKSYWEADFREQFKGAGPVRSPTITLAKFKAKGSGVEGHLPGSQLMSPYTSSQEKGKESDNVRFTLGSPLIDHYHRNEWKHAISSREGATVMGQMLRGGQNISLPSSGMTTQREFESPVAPEMASFSLNSLDEQLNNVSPNVCGNSDVFCEPTADIPGICSDSTWCSQSPLPEMENRSAQTPQGVTREIIPEQKEETLLSCQPIGRDISSNGLQGIGGGPPCKPEPGASVLETYFYYLHVLNKIRGLPSGEENPSLPSQEPKMSESEWVTTSPVQKGRWKEVRLDRETQGWKDESENQQPQGQGCAEEAALQETSCWKPQGNCGMKPKWE